MTVGTSTTRLTPAQFADVVQGLSFNYPLSTRQATLATAVIASRIADRPCRIRELRLALGVTGTAGDTRVDVKVNGATVFTAVAIVDNTDADGIAVTHVDFIDDDARNCEDGDVITIEVTAIPTAGSDLDATLNLDARFDPLVERDILGP